MRNFSWLVFFLAAVGCKDQHTPAKILVDERRDVLTAFFNHGRISFSAATGGYPSKKAPPSDKSFKILIDSMTPIIDSSLVRRILGPLVHREIASKLIRLNMEPSRIGEWIRHDTSEFRVTDSSGISKFNYKLMIGGINLEKDTLYSNCLKIYNPAINMEKNKAVVAYDQNGTLMFSILERDDVWKHISTIPTAIE